MIGLRAVRRTAGVALIAATVAGAATPIAGQTRYDLYVSSRGTDSVKRYDGSTGAYLDDFIAPGSGGLAVTQEVAFGPDGHLYVSGRGNTRILKYDRRTGAFLEAFTTGYPLDEPTKMTFGPDGRLYISQWGQTKGAVARFDAVTGAFIDEATDRALNQAMAHAWDTAGIMYVATFGSQNVERYRPDGTFVDVFVETGLSGAVNLWFAGGHLWVIDWDAGAVKRFDGETGAFHSNFITDLNRAEGWTIGPDGALYVAEWGADVVRRFDAATGAPLGVFAQGGGLRNPNSVVFAERWPDFSVRGAPNTVTVAAGESAAFDLVVAAEGGIPYADSVTLTCAGLPAGTSCTIAPTTVVPGSADATATLTVDLPDPARSEIFPAIILLGIIGASAFGARRLRLPSIIGSGFALVQIGCGAPTDPPQPITTAIEIEATSGDLVRGTTVFVVTAP